MEKKLEVLTLHCKESHHFTGKRLKLLNDSELGKVLGYSLSIDEALLDRDRQAAIPGVTGWDPTDFAYGLILGDGYINKYGAITLRHSWRQRGYLVWKHLMCSRFGYLTEKSTPVRVVNYHIASGKFYVSYRFNTKSCFKSLRASFYPAEALTRPKGRRKTLPADFRERLDEGMLALWLMDDGGQGGNSAEGVVIDLSSFTTP